MPTFRYAHPSRDGDVPTKKFHEIPEGLYVRTRDSEATPETLCLFLGDSHVVETRRYMVSCDGEMLTPERGLRASGSFWGVVEWETTGGTRLTSFVLFRAGNNEGALEFAYQGELYSGGWSSRHSIFNKLGVCPPLMPVEVYAEDGNPVGLGMACIPVDDAVRAGVRVASSTYDEGTIHEETIYEPSPTYKDLGTGLAGVVFRTPNFTAATV